MRDSLRHHLATYEEAPSTPKRHTYSDLLDATSKNFGIHAILLPCLGPSKFYTIREKVPLRTCIVTADYVVTFSTLKLTSFSSMWIVDVTSHIFGGKDKIAQTEEEFSANKVRAQ